MAGGHNWHSTKIEDQPHARQLIDAEKGRKNLDANFNAESRLSSRSGF